MIGSSGYRRADLALILRRGRSATESVLPLSDAAYLIFHTLGAPRLSERRSLDALEEDVKVRMLDPATLRITLGP